MFSTDEWEKVSPASPYSVVLADDHALFRQGVRQALREMEDVVVVGEACDGVELLRLLDQLRPHMAILDISMPNLDGLGALPEIKKKHPHIKVMLLTMHKEKEYLQHAISAGVEGYLLKESADAELFSAIETIRRGEVYFPASLSRE